MSKIELIKGDCLEKMKDIEDNSIDLIVTDPAYKTTGRDVEIKELLHRVEC